MNVDEFLSQVKTGSLREGSERREGRGTDAAGNGRKRPREPEKTDVVVKSGIMKRPNVEKIGRQVQDVMSNSSSSSNNSHGNVTGELEISDEERLRILQMVEDEPEVRVRDYGNNFTNFFSKVVTCCPAFRIY